MFEIKDDKSACDMWQDRIELKLSLNPVRAQ